MLWHMPFYCLMLERIDCHILSMTICSFYGMIILKGGNGVIDNDFLLALSDMLDKKLDEKLEEKLNLINQYKLAGAAFWEKDMESNDIWNLVATKLSVWGR